MPGVSRCGINRSLWTRTLAMPTPYRVRLFRQAQTSEDRRSAYTRASRRDQLYIRRNDPWCLKCFDQLALKRSAPDSQYFAYCYECYRKSARKQARRAALSRRSRIAQLSVHTRICIDCRQQFRSELGRNLCFMCTAKVREEIAARSLVLTPSQVDHRMLVTALHHRYGNRYRSTLTPRIPLHQVGAIAAGGTL